MIAVADAVSRVPPQASMNGLDAGKSTCALPSVTASPEPLSPAAAQTVTPSAAAVWSAASNDVFAWSVQLASALPQLIEIADGLLVVSWIAIVSASRKPLSVFGAK